MVMSNFFKKIRKAILSISEPTGNEIEKVSPPFTAENTPVSPKSTIYPISQVASERSNKKDKLEEVPGNFRKRENAVHCNPPVELLTQTDITKKNTYSKRKKQNSHKVKDKK